MILMKIGNIYYYKKHALTPFIGSVELKQYLNGKST